MIKYTVGTNPPYPVIIGKGMISKIADVLPDSLAGCKTAIITDDRVSDLYGTKVEEVLSAKGHQVSTFSFPAGEESKTIANLAEILEFLAEQGLDRSDLIVALGGGVPGDLAGFAAATYMRGISFVQVPTTLLAAVDSSVGGKTAVNLSRGKNLAGAFWQPISVLCDTDMLKTLPRELYAEGIAEAIKCGVIGDIELFNLMKEPLYPGSGWESDVIGRSVAFKAAIVEEDEKEQGKRALLNFGHTLAHAIEKQSEYRIRHGQAVALGMVIVTRAAELRGFAEKGTLETLLSVLKVHGIDPPTLMAETDGEALSDAGVLVDMIGSDKKKRGGNITLVLPRRIGQCELVSMSLEEAKSFLHTGFEDR